MEQWEESEGLEGERRRHYNSPGVSDEFRVSSDWFSVEGQVFGRRREVVGSESQRTGQGEGTFGFVVPGR